MPAFAGMTGWNVRRGLCWMPACAGMTGWDASLRGQTGWDVRLRGHDGLGCPPPPAGFMRFLF